MCAPLLTQKTYLWTSHQPPAFESQESEYFLGAAFLKELIFGDHHFSFWSSSPPDLSISQSSPSFILRHPGKNTDPVFFTLFSPVVFVWVLFWVCVSGFQHVCPPVDDYTRQMSPWVDSGSTTWSFFFLFLFLSFFPFLSPRVLLVALSERGKNSFSAPPKKTRTHFSQGSQALRGLYLPV